MTSATRFSAKALTAVAARIAAAKRIKRNEIIAKLSPCHRIRSERRSEQGSFGIQDNGSDLAHSSLVADFAALVQSVACPFRVKLRSLVSQSEGRLCPQLADILRCPRHVSKVPRGDI